jgi:hypothetical protein
MQTIRRIIRCTSTPLFILYLLLNTNCVCTSLTQPAGEIVDAEIHVTNPPDGRIIEVKFYVETFKFEKNNKYSEITFVGPTKPFLQFRNNELSVLSMTLYFDSSETGTDVRELTENVLSLMDVDQTIQAPPVLTFQWKAVEFKCVLESAVQEFLSSFPDGRPSRAKMNVSFREMNALVGN